MVFHGVLGVDVFPTAEAVIPVKVDGVLMEPSVAARNVVMPTDGYGGAVRASLGTRHDVVSASYGAPAKGTVVCLDRMLAHEVFLSYVHDCPASFHSRAICSRKASMFFLW